MGLGWDFWPTRLNKSTQPDLFILCVRSGLWIVILTQLTKQVRFGSRGIWPIYIRSEPKPTQPDLFDGPTNRDEQGRWAWNLWGFECIGMVFEAITGLRDFVPRRLYGQSTYAISPTRLVFWVRSLVCSITIFGEICNW